MADVLISYKREDVPLAKALADRLTNLGLTVWWDHNIPAGKDYDHVIEEELDSAKCVIVLWSSLSIDSRNVKDEANEALKRDILIPVLIGNVRQPLGFRMVQAIQWSEGHEIGDDEFAELQKQIQRLVKVPKPVQVKTGKKPVFTTALAWFIIAGLAIAGAFFLVLRNSANNKPNNNNSENTVSNNGLPGRFPQASQRVLTDSDVRQISKSDLKIMRNEIYARRNYIFTTDDMKSYFSQFSWYEGKYTNVNAMLSTIELQNIALIKKYE